MWSEKADNLEIISQNRRSGTSFLEFEKRFPDSHACLEYLYQARFGLNASCPKCNMPTSFFRARSRNTYVAKCCYDAKIYPLKGTIFSRSNLPLVTWFRCILYFTNSASGLSTDFVSRQLGISDKAAVRMAQLIRGQLTAIDNGVALGLGGRTIYVDETTIKSISRKGRKNGVKLRILAATDGHEFIAIPIAKGRFASNRNLLFDRCAAGARLEVRHAVTRQKLNDYRRIHRMAGHEVDISNNPELPDYHYLAAFLVALKRFILQGHIWVSEAHLESYIGHFAFLYRRRTNGEDAFWDAISHFPELGVSDLVEAF